MWMDLEAVKQSELERETQISYINAYMWNLKKKIGIDDFTCKTETQMKKTDVWVSRGKGEWDELRDWNWHKYTTDTCVK